MAKGGSSMEKRIYVDKKILLRIDDDDSSQAKNFHISRKLDEGGSTVCYEGYFKSSTNGILREFYPRNMAECLMRDEQEQLIFKEGDSATKNIFREQRDNYLRPYYMLREKRLEIPELATFLPPFEIYFGANADENSAKTAYIWTPEQNVETFKNICDQIHKHPKDKPETKLFIALQAIRSLTKCICSLHSAELIHRDIKPSNFGFKKLNGEILPQTISLFDIDTICSIYDDTENFAGSEGYVEPEFFFESANNLTDIYSIGATLFSAIIVSDDRPRDDYTYHNEDYNNLKYLVDNSKLITASETNSAPRLREYLTKILRKTLCRRADRFENCEELLKYLDEAYFYLMPTELSRKNINGEKWVIKDAEKSFDKAREKNSLLAIQYHLYEYPLYKKMTDDEKDLHVLIFGFGNYGQKFLDSCLQVGQMVGKNFKATVVSDNASDKEIYLSDRPALKDFFDIDGVNATCGQSYGKISFKVTKIAKNERVANSSTVDDIILELCLNARPHYVFIAMGNDDLNKNAAFACQNALKSLDKKCLVNFAHEEKIKSKPRGIIPLYINQKAKNSPVHSEIERMAFNAHLVWEKNLNIDYNVVRKNFLQPYNHDACVANVLSIKYKLHSIGIDIEKIGNFDEAAKIFVEKNLHRDGKKSTPEYRLRNEIIFVEHKRWVTEKICNGWQQRRLKDCTDGKMKDSKNKTHACILTSRADRLLYDKYHVEEWDTMSQQQFDELDELDKLSVQIHKQFRLQVEETKKQTQILLQRAIDDIAFEISGSRASLAAFSEFQVCLKDIQNGDKNKVRIYENLKSVFEKSLAELNKMSRDTVKNLLEKLEKIFQPILNSMKYIDYKQIDVELIDNIPFILTYTKNITQVIPYTLGDNSEFFANVAAATIVNPAKIIYLALFENKSEITQLKKSLSGLIKYLNRKNLRAEIEFVITCNANKSDCLKLETDILNLGDKKIKRVKVYPLHTKDKLKGFKRYLTRKNKSTLPFLIEKNTTRLSGLMEGGQVYEKFDAYEFNSLTMKFKSFSRCEFLNYINKNTFITVNDLTALNDSGGIVGEQPTFFEDYKELWSKYCQNRDVWKKLCNLLDEHSKNADVIAEFNRPSNYSKTNAVKEYTYMLPLECLRTVEDRILKFLKDKNFIEDYNVRFSAANSFEVTIKDIGDNKKSFQKLFANPYQLFQADSIQSSPNKPNVISIIFDNLLVSNFNLSSQDRRLVNLLKFFADKHYLTNLNADNLSRITFTFATRTIKNLLTMAGKILEIYVWHEIKGAGYFDDVVSNFEPNWHDSDAKNEIDCIAIKNFKVLIIECKARSNIEQDFYYKISAISNQFGINATTVLIADTQENADRAINNDAQRERGADLEVITVWQKDEINAISATLKKIVDGNYKMQTNIN